MAKAAGGIRVGSAIVVRHGGAYTRATYAGSRNGRVSATTADGITKGCAWRSF